MLLTRFGRCCRLCLPGGCCAVACRGSIRGFAVRAAGWEEDSRRLVRCVARLLSLLCLTGRHHAFDCVTSQAVPAETRCEMATAA